MSPHLIIIDTRWFNTYSMYFSAAIVKAKLQQYKKIVQVVSGSQAQLLLFLLFVLCCY